MNKPYTIAEGGESLPVTAYQAATLARLGLVYQCDECAAQFHIAEPHAWEAIESALATLADETPRYSVRTFDVCAQGFERLRARHEFILLAYPKRGASAAELAEEWKADIQACARPDGFDYEAARACVDAFAERESAWIAAACADLDESSDDSDECGEPVTAYLFISDAIERESDS